MKWDLSTISSLYLVALVRDQSIRSLRDLRRQHIGLLAGIQAEGEKVAQEKWGLGKGSLRMYVHYQPSYCTCSEDSLVKNTNPYSDHFHVHIVNASYVGHMGMVVGQAHLLNDIISLASLYECLSPSTLSNG